MESSTSLFPVKLSDLFLKYLVGFFSGIAGSAILGIFLFLSWSIVGDAFSPSEQIIQDQFGVPESVKSQHPLFVTVILVAVFLGTLFANLVFVLMQTLLSKNYPLKSTTITHVFWGLLIIFCAFIPIYLSLKVSYDEIGVSIAALSHITLASLFTFLVLEIFSVSRSILLNLYAAILGCVFFLFSSIFWAQSNPLTIAFLVLPLFLSFLNLSQGIMEMFYSWFYRIYGTDFLNTENRFGSDYGETETQKDVDAGDDIYNQL